MTIAPKRALEDSRPLSGEPETPHGLKARRRRWQVAHPERQRAVWRRAYQRRKQYYQVRYQLAKDIVLPATAAYRRRQRTLVASEDMTRLLAEDRGVPLPLSKRQVRASLGFIGPARMLPPQATPPFWAIRPRVQWRSFGWQYGIKTRVKFQRARVQLQATWHFRRIIHRGA